MSDSDMRDSFQEIATSDISIDRPEPTQRSLAEKAQVEQKDVCYQKIWVSVHSSIFLMIALQTIVLLKLKDEILDKFYAAASTDGNNAYYQCCYCAWIAQTGTQNDGKVIEYSYCNQEYVEYDDADVCIIDGNKYCTNQYVIHDAKLWYQIW